MGYAAEEPWVRFLPLGGVGRFGANAAVYETPDAMVLVDAGSLFPEPHEYGLDYLVPDFSYLLEHRDKLRAIVLTHAHEDHIGALSVLLPRLGWDVPVYGSRFTLGLVRARMGETSSQGDWRLLEPGQKLVFGDSLTVEAIAVTHSIPDAFAIALHTPLGAIVHTGDFKIDPTPTLGLLTDEARLQAIGDAGVLALLSDSTNAGIPGRSRSEQDVAEALLQVMGEAQGCVFVTTFASHVERLRSIVKAATEVGRKVMPVGYGMLQALGLAKNLGFFAGVTADFVDEKAFSTSRRERLVVLATGAQGDWRSAMARLARGEHSSIDVAPGDVVVMSAREIPGNEKPIARMLNGWIKQGARVVDWRTHPAVHTSGHGRTDEQLQMFELCRPRFFIPVHGEERQLNSHAEMALQAGMEPERVCRVENGEALVWKPGPDGPAAEREARRELAWTYVQGRSSEDIDLGTLKARGALAQSGTVVCSWIETAGGVVRETPQLTTLGIASDAWFEAHREKMQRVALKALRDGLKEMPKADRETCVRVALRRYVEKDLGWRPVVLAVSHSV